MKKFIMLILVLGSIDDSFAQKDGNEKKSHKTEADYYWATKPVIDYEIPEGEGKRHKSMFFSYKMVDPALDLSSISDETWQEHHANAEWHQIFMESQARYFREWGMVFWEQFPADDRRFEWLEKTISNPPSYKKLTGKKYAVSNDIPDSMLYDKSAYERWNTFYQRYRNEYLAAKNISADRRKGFEDAELRNILGDWTNFRHGIVFDYQDWIERAIKFAKLFPPNDDFQVRTLIGSFNRLLLEDLEAFGLSLKDAEIIVNKLQSSVVPAFEKVAIGYQKPMTSLLEKYPLKFNVKSTDGKSVELSEYKGKLVLVDFWSIGCSGCIAAMPRWREIYEKYNQYGFELISACFVSGERGGKPMFKDEISKIMAVHEKLSPGWPLVLLHKKPEQEKHFFFDLYEMVGNPTYMLFNENGKPLMTNGALNRNPETVIRKYLMQAGKLK